MARLGRVGCRAGRGRGIPEDTLRNFMFNVLAAVLVLEFLSGINLIVQTSALEVVAPAMPPFQGWRPFHSLASQAEVLVSVSAQPEDGRQRQKKLYSSAVAMSSAHPPISAPSYSSMPGALDLAIYSSDLSHTPVQHTRRLATAAPAHIDAEPPDAASNSSTAPSGLVQPLVSPHNGCCAPYMVQKRGTQDCHCVYPVRIELFLRNVSLTSNWSNEFIQELASQLNLRVNQFEIVNFYVVGASGLNITMDIAPHTGISFAADQVKAMNYSLTLHTVRIDPVLVGDYNLLNLTWFRPLAPAPADPPNNSPISGGSGNASPLNNSSVSPNTGQSRNKRIRIYIIAGTSGLSGLCAITLILMMWYKRCYGMIPCYKWPRNSPRVESFLQKQGTLHPKGYTYSEVKKMTKSFAHKLGQGGFGAVYRGNMPDGREVAVKMLKGMEGDGEEFMNEVASISRTSHVNIVTLVGYCLQGSKRALLYEYMPNGSLERYTFGNNSMEENTLSWDKLFNIVIGIARGLEYLHTGCNTRIVHFDIKPHNILLDQEFCPKISDFGLAKLCLQKESRISIAGARGTIGYIAPEVFSRNYGPVGSKADVYSYGMVVLEMVGARKKIDVSTDDSSSKYFPQWLYENLDQFCGPTTSEISSSGTTEVLVRKMVIVGLWCIQSKPADRPSMGEVLEMLESNAADLQLPPKAFWTGY